jgi:transcriptional regulator with XRE-family HTH domain
MSDELSKRIGDEIRKARKAQRLTQADVAERVGISVEFFARLERGEQTPSVPTLAALMRLLGVSADAALGGAGPREHEPSEPTEFYGLGSPAQRRLYRRIQSASPAALRLLGAVLTNFDHAVLEATRPADAPRPRSAPSGGEAAQATRKSLSSAPRRTRTTALAPSSAKSPRSRGR